MDNAYAANEGLHELHGFFGMQVGGISLICSTPYIVPNERKENLKQDADKMVVKVVTSKKSEQKVPLILIPYKGTPLAHERRIKRRRLDFDVEEINCEADEMTNLDGKMGMETKKAKMLYGKRLRMDD